MNLSTDPLSEANAEGAAAGTAPPGGSAQTDGPQGGQLVIWGTDVVVSECKDRFKAFVQTFVDPDAAEDERCEGMNTDEPLYLQKLEEVCVGSHSLFHCIIFFIPSFVNFFLFSCNFLSFTIFLC